MNRTIRVGAAVTHPIGTKRQQARVAIVLSLVSLIAFWPGLRAGFLSDSFIFLEIAQTNSLWWTLGHYVPAPDTWYRPTTELVFWLEFQAFGANPLGYHVFALACHLASSLLLYSISTRITGDKRAGILSACVFALSIHAQEVVYDIADLHNALGGVALLAPVLAVLCQRRRLAFMLFVLALTVDEAALLLVPFLAWYNVLFTPKDVRRLQPVMRHAAAQVWPFAVVAAGYLLLRLGVTQAGFFNETEPCRTQSCLVTASQEYLNRLFVRPDRWRAELWVQRREIALVTTIVLSAVVVLLQPWRWRTWRPVLFALGWIVGGVLFSILTLFPYVADRFVYIPDMGLALLAGAVAHAGRVSWMRSARLGKAAISGSAAVLILWLGLGMVMLRERGERYYDAGEEAKTIMNSMHAALPSPPSNAVLIFRHVPTEYSPPIPPGNTGPFLFHNGLASAVRLRYDRRDLVVYDAAEFVPDPVPVTAIWLEIRDDTVVRGDAMASPRDGPVRGSLE